MWTIDELINILKSIKEENKDYDVEIHNMNFSINGESDIVTIKYVLINKKGHIFEREVTFKDDWISSECYKI